MDSKLIGSNIYLKKAWQTATIDKDDSTFSIAYSLLKIKSKAFIFANILKFLEICVKHVFARVRIFLQFYFDSFELLKWQKK